MSKLNAWLRKTPQPVAVLADDKRIEVPKTGRAWKEITETIEALGPSKVTCLDATGGILRSMSLDGEEDSIAKLPAVEEPLVVFARLLEGAYEKGSKTFNPVIESMTSFIERQSQRLLKSESECDRLRERLHKVSQENAQLKGELASAPEGDGEGGIMGAMLQGMASAAALQQQQDQQGATPITKGKKQ